MKFYCLMCGTISYNESEKKENICKECAEEEDKQSPSSDEMGSFYSFKQKLQSPYLLLILATCLWAGNFVVGRALVTQVPPITLSFYRWVLAGFVLFPFVIRSIWIHRQLWVKYWRIVLIQSATGIAGFNTLLYIAVQYTTSINAVIVNMATPIVIVLLSFLFLKERIRLFHIIGIILSSIGVLWIASRGSLDTLFSLQLNIGDLWMLAAVLSWAIYSILVKKTSPLFPPYASFGLTIILAVLLLLPFYRLELRAGLDMVWNTGTITGLLYISLLSSIVAFMSWNLAVGAVGPARASNFIYLMPFFSAIFATLFLGEIIEIYHLAGGLFILAGVYFATRKQKTKQENVANKERTNGTHM